MKLSRRVLAALLAAAVLLLAGLLFWPFILNGIIQPAALVAWLLLRIFILSVDQRLFWAVLILGACVLLFRLLASVPTAPPPQEFLDFNETINTIEYWHSRFALAGNSTGDDARLRNDLARLLASIYASQQHAATNFGMYDALQRGEIPLPEPIRSFLFPEKPQGSGFIKKLLHSIREGPRRWFRRWTGQERAERYRMINSALEFMEESLEIKNEQ